jgi:hypothetical protein
MAGSVITTHQLPAVLDRLVRRGTLPGGSLRRSNKNNSTCVGRMESRRRRKVALGGLFSEQGVFGEQGEQNRPAGG